MHPAVNHLVQLQELILIREEQKVAGHPEHLARLNESIDTMTARLPEEIKTLFHRLLSKDRTVIVPVAEGFCAACGMQLPISLIQAVRLGREVHACPNCARLLFFPESPPRRRAARRQRFGAHKIGVSRFSAPQLMLPRMKAADKESAIRELATKMHDEGFVDEAEKLIEEALRREATVSTGIEHGLAFPHVRGVEGGGLTLALGTSGKGIRFDPLSLRLTRIVFFIVIPTAASAFYLKLLSGLTQTFVEADARKALLAEQEPEGLWKALTKATRSTIK